jgi:hypothetical protein
MYVCIGWGGGLFACGLTGSTKARRTHKHAQSLAAGVEGTAQHSCPQLNGTHHGGILWCCLACVCAGNHQPQDTEPCCGHRHHRRVAAAVHRVSELCWEQGLQLTTH